MNKKQYDTDFKDTTANVILQPIDILKQQESACIMQEKALVDEMFRLREMYSKVIARHECISLNLKLLEEDKCN